MLPAQYRMTRSTDFGQTVSKGIRAAQPDLVVHTLRVDDPESASPKIGLVVSKSVGNAVERHRVSRRLRHAAKSILHDLTAQDRVVIRALPSSRHAVSARLEQELRSALQRTRVNSRGRRP